eukprot:3107018-Heterocapsa_arctica.AAC.1
MVVGPIIGQEAPAELQAVKHKDAKEAGATLGPEAQKAELLRKQARDEEPLGKATKEGPGRKNNTSSEQ